MSYTLVLLLPAVFFGIIGYFTAVPRGIPRGIPVIPLWLNAYDVLRGVSRAEFYDTRIRRPIEKYGAVVLWHEVEWTVVVSKPEYLVKLFKNSDRTLKKNGAAVRVPWSTGSKLFGTNIIDSDDELYAKFRKILRPGFAIPLPFSFTKAKSLELSEELLEIQNSQRFGAAVCIGPSIWRWALSVWSDYFLDTQFEPLDYSEYNIQQILGAINNGWVGRFKSLFLVFDRLPWKLAITRRTDQLLHQLGAALVAAAEEKCNSSPSIGAENKVGYLLHRARQDKLLSDSHYASNLKQLFVAGYENIETVLTSAMSELATHTNIQELLHAELTNVLPPDYSFSDLDELPLLKSVIYETLRLYPPLGQLINRRTTEPFGLDSAILIQPGILIGWHAYGVQIDPKVWGESARVFDPFRWGIDAASIKRILRNRHAQGQYIPFGIYGRRCLGSSIALQQLQCAICEIVRNLEWEHTPGYKFSFRQVSIRIGSKGMCCIIN